MSRDLGCLGCWMSFLALLGAPGAPAVAQSERPLTTESADTLAWGSGEVELGIASFRTRPAGERGRLWNLPQLGATVGIGPAATLKVEGSGIVWFEAERGESSREPGDLTIWTKVRFWRGTPFQPVVAGRVGAKLPVTSEESGLGTDEVDFFAQVILSQNVSQSRLHLNLGLAVLGDPERPSEQNDTVTYALSFGVPLTSGIRLVGEVAGQQGAGTFFDRSFVRAGARWKAAGATWDAALSAGLIDQSEDWGLIAGVVLPYSWTPKEAAPAH